MIDHGRYEKQSIVYFIPGPSNYSVKIYVNNRNRNLSMDLSNWIRTERNGEFKIQVSF